MKRWKNEKLKTKVNLCSTQESNLLKNKSYNRNIPNN